LQLRKASCLVELVAQCDQRALVSRQRAFGFNPGLVAGRNVMRLQRELPLLNDTLLGQQLAFDDL
jgi:hypothetical protein